MIRAIRAKLTAILADRWFLAIAITFVACLNYAVLLGSGLLQPRPETQALNQVLRYTLLINNFHITCQTWGLLLPIFLGCRILADDRASGQLYVTLTGNPRRARFLLGNWMALVAATLLIMAVVVANYWTLALTLKIKTVLPDFLVVMGSILLNMLVLLTITAAAASAGTVVTGIIAGLGALTVFNLAAYQSVPFIAGGNIAMGYATRRLLATLAPIQFVYAPSVSHAASLARYVVVPYVIGNMFIWQGVFIGLVLGLSLAVFQRRDL